MSEHRITNKLPIEEGAALSYTLQLPKPDSDPVPNGRPLVVFVSGLRTSMSDWIGLMAELDFRADHRISLLAYDRFGCGDSDSLPSSRQTNDIATSTSDLRILLKNVINHHSLRPSDTRLVLVGSSIGCCMVRLLLQDYPLDLPHVQSVIMLDSYLSNSDFVSLFPQQRDDEPEPLTRTRDIVTRIFHPSADNPEGLDRSNAAELLPSPSEPKLPADVELIIVAHDSKHMAHEMAEKIGIDEDIYLKYVDTALVKYHEGLAKLSPSSRKIVAENSGHFIHHDRPDIVVQEIMRCINLDKQS